MFWPQNKDLGHFARWISTMFRRASFPNVPISCPVFDYFLTKIDTDRRVCFGRSHMCQAPGAAGHHPNDIPHGVRSHAIFFGFLKEDSSRIPWGRLGDSLRTLGVFLTESLQSPPEFFRIPSRIPRGILQESFFNLLYFMRFSWFRGLNVCPYFISFSMRIMHIHGQ